MASDTIPRPVKRQLRQEAGFGCCRCGHPFLEFHHIVPRSVEPHNRPEDMMALCPTCHAMATAGALPEAEQRALKATPVNIARGRAEGFLKLDQAECAVMIGAMRMGGNVQLLRVDGEGLLAILLDDDGQFYISVTVYDEDDNLLLLIDRNDWVTGDAAVWDIEYGFRHLTLRRAHGDIVLSIDARQDPVRLRANLWKHGNNIQLGPPGEQDVIVTGMGRRWFMGSIMTGHNMCVHVDTYRRVIGIGLGVVTRL
jgi:hypothetical protein